MATPIALSTIGYQHYIVYAIIGLTYVVSVYFLYPETMDQSLEKLEDLFQQDMSIPETVRIAKKLSGLPPDEEVRSEQLKVKVEQIE
jgi:hypothetical protein